MDFCMNLVMNFILLTLEAFEHPSEKENAGTKVYYLVKTPVELCLKPLHKNEVVRQSILAQYSRFLKIKCLMKHH